MEETWSFHDRFPRNIPSAHELSENHLLRCLYCWDNLFALWIKKNNKSNERRLFRVDSEFIFIKPKGNKKELLISICLRS